MRRLGLIVALVAFCAGAAPDVAAALRWSRRLWIDRNGNSTRLQPEAVSCPTRTLCFVVTASDLAWSTDPARGHWHNAVLIATHTTHILDSISCPSASFCAATDVGGHILTSTNPTGGAGAWKTVPIAGSSALSTISCASRRLCVAGDQNGVLWTSTDPTGGPEAWTANRVDAHRTYLSVACASVSLCVAVDFDGGILSSHDPAGGPTAWKIVSPPVPSDARTFESVACPTVSLCVVADWDRILTSTDPTGDSSAWKSVNVGAGNAFSTSCPTATMCAVTGRNGVLSSTDPVAGRWKLARLRGNLGGISCPTDSLCVALEQLFGGVRISTHPTGPASAWTGVTGLKQTSITGVSCPSTSLCVAVDDYGRILHTTNPAGGAGSWAAIDLHRISDPWFGWYGVTCPSVSLCIAYSADGQLATTTRPTGGKRAWRETYGAVLAQGIDSFSCGSPSLCAASWNGQESSYSGVAVTTMPTAGQTGWHLGYRPSNWHPGFTIPPNGGTAALPGPLSCVGRSLCVAFGLDGPATAVWTSRKPSQPGTWREERLPAAFGRLFLAALVCPWTTFCAGADAGNILTSTNPASTAWKTVSVDPGRRFTALTCRAVTFCVAADSAGRLEQHPTDRRGGGLDCREARRWRPDHRHILS